MKALVFSVALAAAATVGFGALAAEEFGIQPNMIRATFGLMGKEGMTLLSKDFKEGERIPVSLSSYGPSNSPQLTWINAPKGTKSFAVALEDGDANRDGVPILHWLAWGIPANVTSLPGGLPPQGSGALPKGMVMGKNIQGKTEYMGPRPPAGVSHIYHYQVFALDKTINLPAGATRADFMKEAKDHVLASTELDGWFTGPPAPPKS